MYNYVYGVSNIRYWEFAGGIFLGSLKPYFLDSYLGYFGKSLVDGSAAAQAAENGGAGTLQDYVLIGVLGFSVLIGVFASQLAAETWDAILKEQEEEEKKLKGDSNNADDDDVMTEIFGWELPQWAVGFQYGLNDAGERVDALVLQEYDAKVWNCTEENSVFGIEISKNTLPDETNPVLDPKSPEITGKYQGFDYGGMTCDGIVLSPILFTYFLKFADPLFNDKTFQEERMMKDGGGANNNNDNNNAATITAEDDNEPLLSNDSSTEGGDTSLTREFKEGTFLNQLLALKDETRRRLEEADEKINRLNDK
jgi:hypothetical protein